MGEWAFDGYIREAGGGTALIVVGRDTAAYPTPGAYVTVTVHDPDPSRRQPTSAELEDAAEWRRQNFPGIKDLQMQVEDYVKRRSEEDWQVMIAQVNDLTRQRDELAEHLGRTVAITNEPLLGLADTESLMRELITRFRMEQYNDNTPDGATISVSAYAAVDRAIALAEMLGGLSATEKEHRPVDHD